jgi:hypothetical protein
VERYFKDNSTFDYFNNKINFKDVISVANNVNRSIFAFCPDGTCDIVAIDRIIEVESTLDYGMVYLFYFSDYFSTKKLATQNIHFMKGIFDKYKCDFDEEKNAALCVMSKIVADIKVSIFYARHDEGFLCISKKCKQD